MAVRDYRELKVWQKGIEIVEAVYRLTKGFPREELYGLSQQMRRAAVSVPSNIAEGFARNHTGEYIHFCHISLGSCAELATQFVIARRLGYITDEQLQESQESIDHESRMLSSLVRSLKSRDPR